MSETPRPFFDGSSVQPVQLLNIDAANQALDMLTSAYHRLRGALAAHGAGDGVMTGAIADAWTVIDNAHRLDVLLRQMPGMKQKAPPVRDALAAFRLAEPFRHAIQHLDREIRVTAAAGRAVWGELYWAYQGDAGQVRVSLMVGRPYGLGARWTTPPTPGNLDVSSGPTFIHLLRHPHIVNLSAITDAAETFRAAFDTEIDRALRSISEDQVLPTTLRLFVPSPGTEGASAAQPRS